MKKGFVRAIAVLVVMGLLLAGMSIGAVAAEKKMKFVLVAHSAAISFWVPVKKGAEDAAKALGVDVVFTGPAEFDIPKQVAMIESAINSGIDGLATTLPDPEAFDSVVQKGLNKGIPVVAFNTDDSTPNPRMSSIAQNQIEAGKAMGREIVKLVGKGGRIALTTEAPGHSALEQRMQGAKEILDAANIKVDVLNTTTDLVKAIGVIESYYLAHPDTKGWFGVSATATAAGGQVVKKRNLKGKVHAGGFDLVPLTLDAIEEGYMDFTVDQNPYIQGYYAVVEMYLYNKYGIYPSMIDTGAGFITAKNVKEVKKLADQGYR